MIVGVCGYGYSGSGAVFDFLKEFPECDIKWEWELPILYIPHGIQDLEYHLLKKSTRFFSSDVAIKEFLKWARRFNSRKSDCRKRLGKTFTRLTEEFVKDITQVRWTGTSWDDTLLADEIYLTLRFRILGRFLACYEKLTSRKLLLPKTDVIYLAVDVEDFVEKAKKYLWGLLMAMGYDFDRIAVLNQPFDVNQPESSMKYFENAKAILVDRDPRDIYILAKKYLKTEGSFIPSENVEDFIKYHRLVRKNYQETYGDDILQIALEDLVYHYESTGQQIKNFLGIEGNGQNKKRYFDPEISIGNTQLFCKHPELAEDIRKIECALPEYLYPFENCEIKPNHIYEPF